MESQKIIAIFTFQMIIHRMTHVGASDVTTDIWQNHKFKLQIHASRFLHPFSPAPSLSSILKKFNMSLKSLSYTTDVLNLKSLFASRSSKTIFPNHSLNQTSMMNVSVLTEPCRKVGDLLKRISGNLCNKLLCGNSHQPNSAKRGQEKGQCTESTCRITRKKKCHFPKFPTFKTKIEFQASLIALKRMRIQDFCHMGML